ncbi:MAG: sodium-dependent transporter [Clostridia bacterium]|nr:sodium-dependent transporter [Clostridia bacterium]
MEKKKRGNFTGSIGFVLAAAGSAVGLGNLWRFPYLAAKDGGGIFLFFYIILALTFGFTLMTTEIAIGRKTGKSCIDAYGMINKNFKFLGPVAFLVPFIIFPYYCVIGGWVMKYAFTYITGNGTLAVADGYFGGFITAQWSPIFWCALFMFISALVVFFGVEKGIEKFSKILMPVLSVIIIGIAVFSCTVKDPASGRSAVDGLKIYLIPNFDGMTISKFFRVLLDAMGQLFYSMSLAMGIMITYGSYSRKDTNLVKSVNQIEIFDTAIALTAGFIMIPTVYTFMGSEGLNSAGLSLLFISMPKVFSAMGNIVGGIVGSFFFVLVIFAALTSSVSLMEAIASMIMDKTGIDRKKTSIIVLIVSLVIAVVTCLGYNVWYFECKLPNNSVGQILDILDYITNNLLMPIVALITCLLIGWVTGAKTVTDEIKRNGEKFGRERLYNVMVKYIAPVFLILILISSFGVFDNL